MPTNCSVTHRKNTGGRLLTILLAGVSAALAQSEISIQEPPPPPVVGWFLKPFHVEPRIVAPANLTNSPRLQQLVRGGNLYLSVQDVIALVLENNLDIAVQRYSPFLSREVQRRADSGQYPARRVYADRRRPYQREHGGRERQRQRPGGRQRIQCGRQHRHAGGTCACPTWIHPSTPSSSIGHYYDARDQRGAQPTEALVDSYRYFAVQYNQSFITGTSISVTFYENRYFYQNGATTLLENPVLSGYLDFSITQPFCRASAWRSTTATSRWPATT